MQGHPLGYALQHALERRLLLVKPPLDPLQLPYDQLKIFLI
jgi:hypothetical protein